MIGQLTSAVIDPEAGYALALGYVKHAQTATGTELRTGEHVLRVRAEAGAD